MTTTQHMTTEGQARKLAKTLENMSKDCLAAASNFTNPDAIAAARAEGYAYANAARWIRRDILGTLDAESTK